MNKKLKILVGISIFGFFVICVSVLTSGFIVLQRAKEAQQTKEKMENQNTLLYIH